MRRLLFPFLFLSAGAALAAPDAGLRPASPEELALFQDALTHGRQDTEHWAYTETTVVRDRRGRVKEEAVVRFDPSKPYAGQYTPLSIDGKPPTERQLRQYRKKGEERHEQREKALPEKDDGTPQVTINDTRAMFDLEHPLVVAADDRKATFEIPLRTSDGTFPVEKLQVVARVDRQSRRIEQAAFRVREAFRVKLIARIIRGEVVLEMEVVDPEFEPVITSVHGNLGASLFLIPVNATFTSTRADWRRVKAYDERFGVKLAPLKFPGF